ncbi:hypothetical protein [Bacillus sp. OV322]|uniref:hypothetical protein n=1 Tax=Bacillus sp. OV322 TaxID=1882764 RepID=UPI0015A68FB7|nr:hypothetical protein [Bacillus sp. OV322]
MKKYSKVIGAGSAADYFFVLLTADFRTPYAPAFDANPPESVNPLSAKLFESNT